jgi:hypothetical protein
MTKTYDRFYSKIRLDSFLNGRISLTEFPTTKVTQPSGNPYSERQRSRVSLGVGQWPVLKFPSRSSLEQSKKIMGNLPG